MEKIEMESLKNLKKKAFFIFHLKKETDWCWSKTGAGNSFGFEGHIRDKLYKLNLQASMYMSM